MDTFVKGFFSEEEITDTDHLMRSVKCHQLIHQEKSDYQNVVVFKNESLGLCLALDGAIQLSEKDEFSYQEMITFLPLNSHPEPKRVLIIGGGDGGVIREALKHPMVEEIVLCEIDEAVIRVSREYLGFMSSHFDNPKVKILIQDGYEYIRNNKSAFDVIITDSSDPKGPAISLFQREYYQSLYECLRSGGIIACQAESIWYHLPLIKSLHSIAREIFATVAYATTMVATYPSGQIGFLMACKDKQIQFNEPIRKLTDEQVSQMGLKYYSSDIHRAAFVLPVFVTKELESSSPSEAVQCCRKK
ncbi:spermidine Synthase [Brevipalpus obovatus]|uniref:spermidine Synthase n=1 Tax=Brevipalpus obovatus TaxID=246614 RepID=UPI003D9EF58C